MKKTLLLLFFVSFHFIFSQTNVSGGIFSNTIWTVSGSPYVLTGDVALFPGYSLTIEPGVVLKFNTAAKLILRGPLYCNGTTQDKITFTSNALTPVKGDWYGIQIENSQGGKILGSNLIGEYATRFMEIKNASSGEILNIVDSEIRYNDFAFYGYDGNSTHTVILDNLSVHDNTYAYIYAQNVTLTNSVFSDGEKGIHCWEFTPNMYITNCEFYNFSIRALSMQGEVSDCHIHDNVLGVNMVNGFFMTHSTVENNVVGIELAYPLQISGNPIHDNTICNNLEYNFKYLNSYPIDISNNCWCSSDINVVAAKIYDAYDDASSGIATFTPMNSSCTLDVDVVPTNKEFAFYPNPATHQITFSHDGALDFVIYDTTGKIIKQGVLQKNLLLSDMHSGFYFIRISKPNSGVFQLSKLIKQ